MEPLVLADSWQVAARDLRVSFARSGGPGGQNVNKVSTKVELRLLLTETSALSENQKERLRGRYPSACTNDGEFIVVSDETRSQAANLERARARLKNMILSIQRPPAPRRPTRPSRAAKRRRLDEKRHRASLKRSRTKVFD